MRIRRVLIGIFVLLAVVVTAVLAFINGSNVDVENETRGWTVTNDEAICLTNESGGNVLIAIQNLDKIPSWQEIEEGIYVHTTLRKPEIRYDPQRWTETSNCS